MPNHVETDFYIEGKTEDVIEFLSYLHYRYVPDNAVDDMGHFPNRSKYSHEEWLKIKTEQTDKYRAMYKVDDMIVRTLIEAMSTQWFIPNLIDEHNYDWQIANWETKWGFYETNLHEVHDYQGTTEITGDWRSAWSPANKIVLTMSEMFPKIAFGTRYFEGGMGYNGMYDCKDGVVIADEEGKYFGSRGG